MQELKTAPHRQPEHPVDAIFPNRWSPRAMNGQPLARETLMTLFEAARWAPSSSNNQPWRFVYAVRDTEAWPRFFDLLVVANQVWCKNAAALVVIVSKTTFDHSGKPSLTHSFDAGSAWMSLALQGSLLGLVVHGLQGFDYGKAREILGLSEEFAVEAMCAVGNPAPAETLPETLREREKPSGRKKVEELAFEGRLPT
jgi:nitroreductase